MTKNNKKIGLALGAGGWRGLAHIGVIKVLEENHIKVDYIAGSSTGALFGGLYAATADIGQVEKMALKLDSKKMLSALFDLTAAAGFIKGEKVVDFLRSQVGQVNIEELPISFAAVTTNLFSGQTSPIMAGELAPAIRASGSIPVVFDPVEHKGERYVDGALSMPVPVKIARSMGADVVIAVNLYDGMFPQEKELQGKGKLSPLKVARLAQSLWLYNLALDNAREADAVVNPPVDFSRGSFRGFVTNKDTIKKGRWATEKVLDKITTALT